MTLTKDDIHITHWCPWQNKDCEICKKNKRTKELASKVADELEPIIAILSNDNPYNSEIAWTKLLELQQTLQTKEEKL